MGNILGIISDQPIKSQKEYVRRQLFNEQDSFVIRKVEQEEETDSSLDNIKLDLNEIVHLCYDDDGSKVRKGSCRERFHSEVLDEVDTAISVDIRKYQFPFENLVFEGGGNKGLAYCGAIKVLEDLNIMQQIKRYAGASAGAMTAALLAVEYKADEIREFLSQDISQIFIDHSFGYLSLLPNLLSGFGWNPGNRIVQWFGEKLAKKTANPDVTFYELYKMEGKELCIVVTNLNMMTTEYCHPKTTPDMPIRIAVRMSMAIPGLFQAIKYKMLDQSNWYVDGGVLNNYPINCFDGWWLSMDRKDSFLNKMQPLDAYPELFERKGRFGTANEKTLGFMLYADTERDILRDRLERRQGTKSPEFPQTKLGKEKSKKRMMKDRARIEHRHHLEAIDAFLKSSFEALQYLCTEKISYLEGSKDDPGTYQVRQINIDMPTWGETTEDNQVLRKHNTNMDEFIDRNELQDALRDEDGLSKDHKERLFGSDKVEDVFDFLDENKDGKIVIEHGTRTFFEQNVKCGFQISFQELVLFIERKGICLHSRFVGYQRKEIEGVFSFFDTLQSALLLNVKRYVVKAKDIKRTVGINTGHVDTSDFNLEKEDREFVVQQGKLATESFLHYYASRDRK